MRNLLIGLMLLIASYSVEAQAREELIYETEYIRITLQSKACTDNTILSFINREFHKHFHAAVSFFQGRTIAACWAIRPDGVIIVVDEEGDSGELDPRGFFKTVI